MNDLRKKLEEIPVEDLDGQGQQFTGQLGFKLSDYEIDAILDVIIHYLPEVYGEDGIQNYNDGYTAAIVKVVEILTAAKEGK